MGGLSLRFDLSGDTSSVWCAISGSVGGSILPEDYVACSIDAINQSIPTFLIQRSREHDDMSI